MSEKVSVVLVDDHVLLRNALAKLIREFGDYTVLFEASNGQEFINKLQPRQLPSIVLLDINMPEMDGYQTCSWLKGKYPDIKVLALSMIDNEYAIIKMFKSGARGYILKDCEPSELKSALHAVHTKGFYYSEIVAGTLIRSMKDLDNSDAKSSVQLTEKEIVFLKFVCTELTYKDIAEKLFLSPRTIDGYREDLFQKLNLKTRVGLAMFAIKNGIVTL